MYLEVIEKNIPIELKSIAQWVSWRAHYINGKMVKIPYSAHNGRRASSTYPNTWAKFDLAYNFYRTSMLDGVGFVLGNNCNISVIDIDHCRDINTGILSETATRLIMEVDSYTELSPSGTGIHIFSFGQLPEGRRRSKNIEMYDSARYVTVTGQTLDFASVILSDRSDILRGIHSDYFPPIPDINIESSEDQPVRASDDTVLSLARNSKGGATFSALFDNGDSSMYDSHSEADLALVAYLCFFSNNRAQVDRLFRRSALMREKWDEMHGRDTYGNITIDKVFSSRMSYYQYVSNDKPRRYGKASYLEAAMQFAKEGGNDTTIYK